ncbi:hypothetical protein EJ419_03105 [Alloscardovia theropitheci]|uniref:Uncharacterized protein n=1 Tax=Alloscardovia theropitheci TaxID=2496842 RepID=A0A4R0QSN6_9BIFI|nr:hypothetical protein [Alloscardovia theropitheci]TCD54478.1 hypothetical protein EJ419_03105 [Alloscardovia theropitheci]
MKQRKIFDSQSGFMEIATNTDKIAILATDANDINKTSITFYDKKTLEKVSSIPLDGKLKDALWRGYWNTNVNHISIKPRY